MTDKELEGLGAQAFNMAKRDLEGGEVQLPAGVLSRGRGIAPHDEGRGAHQRPARRRLAE